MSGDSDDFFGGLEGDFDAEKITLEEMAKTIVPLFRAFATQGLSPQEAAAMTAALVAQGMPGTDVEPKED